MTESAQPSAMWQTLAGSIASAVVMPCIMRPLLTSSVDLQSPTVGRCFLQTLCRGRPAFLICGVSPLAPEIARSDSTVFLDDSKVSGRAA
jgi:hypothetical protein